MDVRPEPLTMEEAARFWRDKVKLSPSEFARLSKEAKVRAFAVSGIAKGDELETVFRALQRAIDRGDTFEEFREKCADIFEKRGWTGKRAWRVDNIFRTNIQTAYNVGHYRQLREDADVIPYWQYSAINDSRTRPTHLAMDGRTWPADHPVWDTWFPPNGFRCRCSVIGLTGDQVKSRGITVEEKDPTHRLIEPIDPETGNRMPARQLLPDRGFDINPGRSYWGGLGEALKDRLASYSAPLAAAALKEMVESDGFELFLKEPAGNFPVLRLSDDAAEAIGAKGRVAVFSKESLAKNLKHHPELGVDDYRQLPGIGAAPELIIQTKKKAVVLVQHGGSWYLAAVKATEDGKELFVTSFRKTNGKDVSLMRRNGKVIYEKKYEKK